MYANRMAVAIKTNGRVLREHKDTVYIKFGSEYSVYMKNLNTVRAMVNVYIDGTNITPRGLVIGAGEEVDLQRSIANGNLNEGNSLKFIERTENVEKHRGVGIEDGLVRIEYQFEREYVAPTYWAKPWDHWDTSNQWTDNGYYGHLPRTKGILRGAGGGGRTSSVGGSSLSSNLNVASASVPLSQSYSNDAGVTVPGSISEQKFVSVSSFPVESEQHVMVIKLLGQTEDNRPIAKPVTVKHKPRCITCGRQNRAHSRFCVECGTSLEVIA